MAIEFLAVGRVLRPHGVRGDLLLDSLTDFPEHLAEVDTVYLGDEAVPHPLVSARVHRSQVILRLSDCADRDCADQYRGQLVQIKAAAAAPLPPGRYYHHQLIGCRVVSDEGEVLGELVDILETGANDVYVVSTPDGELLLPAIKSVILSIDVEAKQVTAHLMEGLR
jgi:16S rRNA processing protein RimM